MNILDVKSVTCRRGKRIIFCDINFSLNNGEILLITGANGSGKSSLLRILTGLISPLEGNIHWNGADIAEDDEYLDNLSYVGHLDAVKPELTVSEMLEYWRTLNGKNNSTMSNDPFGVQVLGDKPVRYLSAGQKRRLALSRLLLRDTSLWVLDEPTTALDMEGQSILLQLLTKHQAAGGIAIVATHQELNIPNARRYEIASAGPI